MNSNISKSCTKSPIIKLCPGLEKHYLLVFRWVIESIGNKPGIKSLFPTCKIERNKERFWRISTEKVPEALKRQLNC